MGVAISKDCKRCGVIRAILCRGCNCGIGNFNDDPDRLEKAAAYIRSFKEETW